MSSKQSSAKQIAQRSSTSDEGPSDYAITKSLGFVSHDHFMHSYGLKPGRVDDELEAKLILNAFREADGECSSQSEAGSSYGSDDASMQGFEPLSDDGLDTGSISSLIGEHASSSNGSVESLESYQSFVAPYDSEQDEDDSDEAISSEAHGSVPFHDETDTHSEGGSVSGEHAVYGEEDYEAGCYSDSLAGSETLTSDPSDREDSDSYDVDGDSDGQCEFDCDDSGDFDDFD